MTEMKIERLHFTNPSVRTFDLEISAIIDPEGGIVWASFVTASLFHRQRLIGAMESCDIHVIPGERNEAKINLTDFTIHDMTQFKAFIQRLVPEQNTIHQNRHQSSVTTDLEIIENGHTLCAAIHMSHISSISITNPCLRRCRNTVLFSFLVSNPNPVTIPFGWCHFLLKKGETVLASFDGYFEIPFGTRAINLDGISRATKAEFHGTGILKGFKMHDNDNNWLDHAIRQFKIEVDLDGMIDFNEESGIDESSEQDEAGDEDNGINEDDRVDEGDEGESE